MDCGVYASDLSFIRMAGDDNVGYSHESEHDLAVMVSDFLENGSGDSHRYLNSSDSDSGFSDLPSLADNIKCYKLSMDQYERDLLSVVDSLMQSISEIDLHLVKPGPCNASCIRFSLVKLLRLAGYDAAVCAAKWQGSGKVPGAKWQGSGKVPGGDHEYIDVVNYNDVRSSERVIIDIDFRSHFEIARDVDSYDRILNTLPVVYVGSLGKLKQYLQVMDGNVRDQHLHCRMVLVLEFGFGGWASMTNFVRQVDSFGLFAKCYQCKPSPPHHH